MDSMSHILIHDLLYSSTSTYMRGGNDYEAKLKHLLSLDGKELLLLTNKHKGSVILSEEHVLDQKTMNVDMKKMCQLDEGDYQAVIVDDTCFIREPDVAVFVMKQYAKGSSVVIVAIEGIYDLSIVNKNFNVNWKLNAYTSRAIELNYLGKQIIDDAFPAGHKYVKAHFIVGGGELFAEYVCPEDGPPSPYPLGSPVITSLGDSKSVSYFGFANPADYKGIILKLCYAKAPPHSPTSSVICS